MIALVPALVLFATAAPVQGQTVRIKVCTDSGMVATSKCPKTSFKQLPVSLAKRMCTLHAAKLPTLKVVQLEYVCPKCGRKYGVGRKICPRHQPGVPLVPRVKSR